VTTDPTFASANFKQAKSSNGKQIAVFGLPALFVPNADAMYVLVHGKLLTISFVIASFSDSTRHALVALAKVGAKRR
jgi:hypothetical protein